jgi:hypothetical protein
MQVNDVGHYALAFLFGGAAILTVIGFLDPNGHPRKQSRDEKASSSDLLPRSITSREAQSIGTKVAAARPKLESPKKRGVRSKDPRRLRRKRRP